MSVYTDGMLAKDLSHGLNIPKVSKFVKDSPSDTEDICGKASSIKRWTEEEDELLRKAVAIYNEKNWKGISELVPGRSHVQCLQRWLKVLAPGLIKGAWTAEEDEVLKKEYYKYANEHKNHQPTSNLWAKIAKDIPGRTAKQCRDRWRLNLDPSIVRSPFTEAEDEQLMRLHNRYGNRWSMIKSAFEGRTENMIKIRYRSLMRKIARSWTRQQDHELLELYKTHNVDWKRISKEFNGKNKPRSSHAVQVRIQTLLKDREVEAKGIFHTTKKRQRQGQMESESSNSLPDIERVVRKKPSLTLDASVLISNQDVKDELESSTPRSFSREIFDMSPIGANFTSQSWNAPETSNDIGLGQMEGAFFKDAFIKSPRTPKAFSFDQIPNPFMASSNSINYHSTPLYSPMNSLQTETFSDHHEEFTYLGHLLGAKPKPSSFGDSEVSELLPPLNVCTRRDEMNNFCKSICTNAPVITNYWFGGNNPLTPLSVSLMNSFSPKNQC